VLSVAGYFFQELCVFTCFVEGLNDECNEYCLLFFNDFWKW